MHQMHCSETTLALLVGPLVGGRHVPQGVPLPRDLAQGLHLRAAAGPVEEPGAVLLRLPLHLARCRDEGKAHHHVAHRTVRQETDTHDSGDTGAGATTT